MIMSAEIPTQQRICVDGLVKRLVEHPIYQRVRDEDSLRCFMRSHVFCVWDFMSLLKALQRQLACVSVPWLPTTDAESRRLINEIVLDEESDALPDGNYLSHFELYLQAMAQCEADTRPIRALLSTLQQGATVEEVMAGIELPTGVRDFVTFTMQVACSGQLHRIAAAFTYGREDVIPAMFQELVRSLTEQDSERWSLFLLYLKLHIHHDGDRHAPMSLALVQRLCGESPRLWHEAQETARQALQARLRLWDCLAAEL
jgi:pyrroloquinoline quinone (PQQ) biosynthesis protein C